MAALASHLGEAVDAAGFALAGAIVTALLGESADAARVGDPYRQRLWGMTEPMFFDTIRAAVGAGLGLEVVSEARRTFMAPLRRAVFELFDEAAPISASGVAAIRRIARARHHLEGTFAGYGKTGGTLYSALNLPAPEVTQKGRAKKGAKE
jgi:hypothetical protein